MSTEPQPESQPEAAGQSSTDATPPRRSINPLVLGLVVLVLLAIGIGWYLYSRGYEDTDDAQIDGHLNPIAARIDGTIKSIHVDDNQFVQAGTPLVELDPNDNNVALQQAQAQYDQAVAQLGASESAHHPHRQPQRSHVTASRGHQCRGCTWRRSA